MSLGNNILLISLNENLSSGKTYFYTVAPWKRDSRNLLRGKYALKGLSVSDGPIQEGRRLYEVGKHSADEGPRGGRT